MDIRQRVNDQHEALRTALDGRQSKMWTALPGIIQSFDPAAMTCVVQPSIQGRITQPVTNARPPQSKTTLMNFPQLLDCPVCFPQGGGCALTFPLQQGDECLVVFGSRGIDFWWQNGGVQPPAEARMHDLSDGFVIPGPFSQPRVLADLDTSQVQLRSGDGSTTISLNPQTQAVTIVAPGDVTITGNLTVSGDVTAGAISLEQHVHGEVQTGSDDTGPPQ